MDTFHPFSLARYKKSYETFLNELNLNYSKSFILFFQPQKYKLRDHGDSIKDQIYYEEGRFYMYTVKMSIQDALE